MSYLLKIFCGLSFNFFNACAPVAPKPMEAIAWSSVAEKMPDNIIVQAYLVGWQDTPAARERIIQHLKSYPKGKRAFFTHNGAIISDNPLDKCAGSTYQCPWFDHGIEERLAWFKILMDQLKAADAVPDYFVFDIEDFSSNWQWCDSHDNNAHFDAIEADPRSVEVLKETGLKDLKGVCNFFISKDYQIWNGWMFDHYEHYYARLVSLLLSYNPKMQMSDWYRSHYGADEPLDENCHIPPVRLTNGKLGKGWNFGSHGSFTMYGNMMRTSCRDPEQGLTFEMPRTPFHSLMYDLNRVIAGKRAGTKQFDIWLPNRLWLSTGYQNDPRWYAEWVYHAYLSGASRFLYWNPAPPYGTADEAQAIELSQLMKEVDKLIGYSDKKADPAEMIPWAATEFKSCMTANRKKVCRVTTPDGGKWTEQKI
jgi:hypothetical protein